MTLAGRPDPSGQPTDDRLAALVGRLSLEERVRVLTGETTWTLYPLPTAGLRALTVSDGPIGVRGRGREPITSAQMPAPSAIAATWDEALAGELGTLAAAEARAKSADVVLAPVVNLQRTPVAGRHFECFSEDPLLSGRMAVPYVAAVQRAGVGACVKHFVANDSETERTVYRSRLSVRALREVYLAPFERVVKDAGVWMVMAAYNGLEVRSAQDGERPDGAAEAAPATEHRWLLRELLKEEWEFDGVVVSDWLATKSTAASALGGLDLVMPGPGGPWSGSGALLEAVRAGEVPVEDVDDKVRRILRLAARVGALREPAEGDAEGDAEGTGDPGPDGDLQNDSHREVPSGHQPDTRALLRRAAARATVVLRNEGRLLPLPPDTSRIALIGANALDPFVQGGGSAHVTPPHLSRPLDALREAFPSARGLPGPAGVQGKVTAHRGGRTLRHAPLVEASALDGGSVQLTVHAVDGRQLYALSRPAPWDGALGELPEDAAYVRLAARLRLDEPGEHLLEAAPVGAHRIEIDGGLLSESTHHVAEEVLLDQSAGHPEGHVRRVDVGEDGLELTVSATVQAVDLGAFGRFARMELRHLPPEPGPDEEIAEAVEAARQADTAVVVVGTNPEAESEGWDRKGLGLPGRQDELVRRVAEANPRTVVVVNAGAPVLLPWLDEGAVRAVLWWWLPGQEAGGSLADVLTGACEPSGRLPWTLPAAAGDVPVPDGVPRDGVIDYTDDLDVGHRGWDRLGREPARDFGHGLGYADWSYGEPSAGPWREGLPLEVTVPVRNTGDRRAREVVQVYLEPPRGSAPGDRPEHQRPLRMLAGFTVVEAEPGETVRAAVAVEPRAFEVWDEASRSWRTPAGEYRLLAAHSSRDVRGAVNVHAGGGPGPGSDSGSGPGPGSASGPASDPGSGSGSGPGARTSAHD
ncbi:beta-glucosidase family protein [Streptomyces abyssalis]|uniref:beta-glucosidase family protein n=1 Tax=Streptomyces abyssalis TaxID=933944 RepID=UPI00085BF3F6|nr:glycoside hydrolase family 3 protein [Streptomyces abyssalis]